MPNKTKKTVDIRKLPRDKRPAPTTGQSGPRISLAWDEFNKDERKVLKALYPEAENERKILLIADIAKAARLETLQVRNALRRPVRAQCVRSPSRGNYMLTAKGVKVVDAGSNGAPVESKPKVARTIAPKTARAEESEEPIDLEALKTDVAAALGTDADDEALCNSGLVVVVAAKVGLSDSKVAKVAGLSRGFVIPRVKRLKEAVKDLTDHTELASDIDRFARIANDTPAEASAA